MSQIVVVEMDLTVQNGFSFNSVATALQSDLQREVAPAIAGCDDEETSEQKMLDSASSQIVNVVFGKPEIDPSGTLAFVINDCV